MCLHTTYCTLRFQSEIVLAAMDATKHAKTAKVYVNAGYPTSMLLLFHILMMKIAGYVTTIVTKLYSYKNLEQFEVTLILFVHIFVK